MGPLYRAPGSERALTGVGNRRIRRAAGYGARRAPLFLGRREHGPFTRRLPLPLISAAPTQRRGATRTPPPARSSVECRRAARHSDARSQGRTPARPHAWPRTDLRSVVRIAGTPLSSASRMISRSPRSRDSASGPLAATISSTEETPRARRISGFGRAVDSGLKHRLRDRPARTRVCAPVLLRLGEAPPANAQPLLCWRRPDRVPIPRRPIQATGSRSSVRGPRVDAALAVPQRATCRNSASTSANPCNSRIRASSRSPSTARAEWRPLRRS